MAINIQAEVEFVLGREMTPAERGAFNRLRRLGYANPIDIARELEK